MAYPDYAFQSQIDKDHDDSLMSSRFGAIMRFSSEVVVLLGFLLRRLRLSVIQHTL